MSEQPTLTQHLDKYAEMCVLLNRETEDMGLGTGWTTSPEEWNNTVVLDFTEPQPAATDIVADWPPEWRLVVHSCSDEDGYDWFCWGWYEPQFLYSHTAHWEVSGWTLRAMGDFGGDAANVSVDWKDDDGWQHPGLKEK